MATVTEAPRLLKRRWVSAKTLGEAIDVDPRTLTKWGREGRLPSKRLGDRLLRFDLDGVIKELGLDEDKFEGRD